MRPRERLALALVAIIVSVVLPSSAWGHAYLIRTVPTAGAILHGAPTKIQLTFDEAVEPRFALISVTDPAGRQETTATVGRSPGNPDTLIAPLRAHLRRGWYLIDWHAISVDGHPVQGAFTFAIGPNPGKAPQFPAPKVGGSATSLNLLVVRWVMFLSVMSSIGLFVFRLLIARPMRRRVPETELRTVSRAFVISSVVGLLAIPVYLDFATAIDSMRSVFDVTALVALFRVTAFGRGYVDMALCFALFCLAGWISVWLDKPEREHRSVAELSAVTGALLAAAAVLQIPGTSGHAAQTSPRGLSLILDWLHLVTGSLWLGGLVGLLVLWASLGPSQRVAGLSVIVPRFSNVALVSVFLLLGTGTWATINHLPTVNSLWLTGYGVVILVKIGLLIVAMALGAGNLRLAKPQLTAAASRPELGEPAARLLRRLIGGEALLVTGAVFAAAILSSLAPPPPAFASQTSALANLGPGRIAHTVKRAGFTLQVLVSPNRAETPDSFTVRILKAGRPVRGANVTLTFDQTEMEMPGQEYQLTEKRPGVYSRATSALGMVGKWSLDFHVTPKHGTPFSALILDQANG